mgnify:CR=1 FL=1
MRKQEEIYQLSKAGEEQKQELRALQTDLIQMAEAKILSVRRTTQEAQGKNTPGTDGIAKLSARQRLALATSLRIDEQASSIRRV